MTKGFLKSYDPLVILGILVLIAGIILLTYGFVPTTQPNLQLLSAGPVPISDPHGNYITNPELYFKSNYNGTGSMDSVYCSPSAPSGFYCWGYQYIGTMITYSNSSRIYGAGMIVLAAISIFTGYWFEPLKAKGPHLRPISVKVDQDICVANGVCVALAPSVFQFQKIEGPTLLAPLAYVVDPSGADNDTIIQAAQMCPTGAIIIEDAETGERIHPPLSNA
jgi:ferredoxin